MNDKETMKLALEALETADETDFWNKQKQAITAIKEALAQPIIESYLEKDNLQPEQKRPQNCGTGYCSCIECVMKPSPRAWLIEFENGDEELHFNEQSVGEIHVPLYTAPPQPKQEPVQYKCTVVDNQHPSGITLGQWAKPQRKPWVGLTDEEIQAVAKKARSKDHAVTLTNKFLRDKNT